MRQGKSLTRAARLAHASPKTVRKYAGHAVALVPPGRYAARSSDRLARDLRFLTDEGAIVVRVRSARDASAVARHASAVRRFFETGDTKSLKPFVGRALRAGRRTYAYVTDPYTLARLGNVGEVRYDELYASVR
jgi:hypothetical protein